MFWELEACILLKSFAYHRCRSRGSHGLPNIGNLPHPLSITIPYLAHVLLIIVLSPMLGCFLRLCLLRFTLLKCFYMYKFTYDTGYCKHQPFFPVHDNSSGQSRFTGGFINEAKESSFQFGKVFLSPVFIYASTSQKSLLPNSAIH